MLYICENFNRMRFFKIKAAVLIQVLLFASFTYAQTGHATALEFNKTVHDFGKISVNAGEQHCTFTFTNVSDRPIVIHNILTSCGCTQPEWPRKPIMPGEKGEIKVTYLNDQGPYPFEKNITLYTSASNKPIILRIRGIVYEKEKSLKELFPISVGPLGIMRDITGAGQIEQGYSKSGSISVANLSDKTVRVEFGNLSAGLELKAEPSLIKAGEVGKILYTIDTEKALNWGNTTYTASLLCNGVKSSTKLKINCMIIDNFSSLTAGQKNSGSMVQAKQSSVNLKVKSGEIAQGRFELINTGAGPLIIHKADKNGDDFEISCPKGEIRPGESLEIKATIDTRGIKGEKIYTITLVTNSPKRPLVNLFVAIETE